MKKIAIAFTFLVVCLTYSYGQTSSDTISVKKVTGGYRYYQGVKQLEKNELAGVLKSNGQAANQLQSAQSTYAAAMIFSYTGGFLVGWPVGTALGGGKPEWILAGVGAGLIAIAIPMSRSYNKKVKLAVDTYNNGLKTSSFRNNTELRLSMTGNGIGLTLKF